MEVLANQISNYSGIISTLNHDINNLKYQVLENKKHGQSCSLF